MKKLILFFLAGIISFNVFAQSAPIYQAQVGDTNFQIMLQRWAAMSNKTLHWKAKSKYNLLKPELLNADLKLSANANLGDAITSILAILAIVDPKHPLQACIWENAVVITPKTLEPNECDNPTKKEKFVYRAEPQDKSLYEMINRWGQREGVPVSWQTKVDYQIGDYESFNGNSTLPSSTTFRFAVHKALKFINLKYPLNVNLKECFFPEGVVIQPVYKSCKED